MILPPVPDYQSPQLTRAQQRGEDPPTTADAVGLIIKAVVKLICGIVCGWGVFLIANAAKTPLMPVAVVISGLMCGGFFWQTSQALTRAIRILRKQEVD